jgi:hypothetical protein
MTGTHRLHGGCSVSIKLATGSWWWVADPWRGGLRVRCKGESIDSGGWVRLVNPMWSGPATVQGGSWVVGFAGTARGWVLVLGWSTVTTTSIC